MSETTKCRWFHRWLFLGEKDVIEPVLGPFDPRSDLERTVTKWESICVKCGDKKVQDIEYPSLF